MKHNSKFWKKVISLSIIMGIIAIAATSLLVLKSSAQTKPITAVASTSESGAVTKESSGISENSADVTKSNFAFIAAAIAVSIGSIAGGLAVGYVGAAAMGAIGEKPEIAGLAIVFVGLAEGIAIYGLIIAIMILGKV